jgi:hypothetical protein
MKISYRRLKNRRGYWHALLMEIARWWRARSAAKTDFISTNVGFSKVELTLDSIKINNGDV